MTLKVSLNTIKNQYPGGVQPDKQITGYRAFSNIIKTINANYNIDGGLTFSDVYGRMYYKEYAQYTTERRNSKITIELKKA